MHELRTARVCTDADALTDAIGAAGPADAKRDRPAAPASTLLEWLRHR
jgi:hypothetical protein